MYFRRSARCTRSKIELLKRVSAVRICPGAQSVYAGQGRGVGGSPSPGLLPAGDDEASVPLLLLAVDLAEHDGPRELARTRAPVVPKPHHK